jgi:hypothetical protein
MRELLVATSANGSHHRPQPWMQTRRSNTETGASPKGLVARTVLVLVKTRLTALFAMVVTL